MAMPEHLAVDTSFRLSLGSDPRNTFTGAHCEDFGRYMAATGVYDTSGANNPGWAGVTEFFPTVGKFRVTPSAGDQNVWECPCAPGIFYDSLSACESVAPCRPGLGGCLQKCGGFPGVCLTATVRLPVTGPVRTSFLRWVPPSATAACRAAISDFDAAVLKHENRHKADAARILADAQASPAQTFKACAKTKQDAKVKLAQLVHQAARDQVDAMSKAYADSVAAFHETPAGRPVSMDCGAC